MRGTRGHPPRIWRSRRAALTLGLAGGVMMLAVVPWSGRVSAPAVLKAGDHVVLYAPTPALLQAVTVREGQTVAPGAVVAELANPDLDHRRQQAERRIAVLRHELAVGGLAPEFRSRSPILARELETVLSARTAIMQEQRRLILTSPIGGTVIDRAPTLHPGQWIPPWGAGPCRAPGPWRRGGSLCTRRGPVAS
ncbi:MAG: hypothetical protein FD149_800 [Rhodospirillaceae bacterium]|nr:MAG: hypothetical protein FD149_800 [Rhodospirillaceae bacterium]